MDKLMEKKYIYFNFSKIVGNVYFLEIILTVRFYRKIFLENSMFIYIYIYLN